MRSSCSKVALCLAFTLLLSACSSHHSGSSKKRKLDPFAGTGSPYYKGRGAIPFAGGRYQVGNPYQVAGRWFKPRDQPDYDKKGLASWYGEAFHRRMTSNGEYFDMATFTAAHATLPLPSYAKVTNLENGRTVVVRINDRGPFVDTRILDVSKRAADALGYRIKGTANVRVQLIGPAPLQDKGGLQVMAMNEALSNGASLNQLASISTGSAVDTPIRVATERPRKKWVEPKQNIAYEPPSQMSETGYVVRVAIFHDMNNANAAYQQVASFGPAQIVKSIGVSGPLYRVQIGPLDNEQDAQSALETALASGYDDARIVPTQITQVSSN